MTAPGWRLFGIAAVGTAAFVLPGAVGASRGHSIARLRADQASLAHQQRSAILGLYSLDSRLRAAYARLVDLRRSETALRSQRAALATALRLAKVDARLSQRELAARVRSLYDHGSASALEVVFGAGSLTEAMTELDNLDRLSTLDQQILVQVRSARLRELATRTKLGVRETRLKSAIREAGAEARSLAGLRAARSAYIARLASRASYAGGEIARLEAEARAAEAKAARLTAAAPPPGGRGWPTPPSNFRTTLAGGNTVSVVSTGYCLTGRTATGLPVGWGVAAVDPRLIPLGTHLTIPGYGEAVAADTGGSVVGGRIDLWFPSCAQAGGWGSRSVTIALH